MAKGINSKTSSKNPRDWQQYDFVNITLTESDKAKFAEWQGKQGSKVYDQLDGLIQSGYKLSSSYDEANKCNIVSLTCREIGDVNYGYVLSSRAGNIWDALALTLYKHYEMCDDGDWAVDQRKTSNSWG